MCLYVLCVCVGYVRVSTCVYTWVVCACLCVRVCARAYVYLCVCVRVSVPEVRLDLHLPPQLVFDPSLLQLLLEQHLQGQDEHRLPLPGQVHVTKLALPQRTADVKVLQAPALPERQSKYGTIIIYVY